MNNIQHIFFDLDNTLWDFDKNSREAIKQLFEQDNIEHCCNTDFFNFIEKYETINHEYWHLYGLNQITKEELRYARFYKTFTHFNYDNLKLAHRWADEYLTISPYKTHLVDGAISVLDYLKPNYTLHLITNGFKEVQDIKLKSCGLKNYFEHIIISEEHGFNKPDIRIFELAEKLANTKKNHCVMIGDNFSADIQGAINAGWKSVFFSKSENESYLNDYIQITKLEEIKGIL